MLRLASKSRPRIPTRSRLIADGSGTLLRTEFSAPGVPPTARLAAQRLASVSATDGSMRSKEVPPPSAVDGQSPQSK